MMLVSWKHRSKAGGYGMDDLSRMVMPYQVTNVLTAVGPKRLAQKGSASDNMHTFRMNLHKDQLQALRRDPVAQAFVVVLGDDQRYASGCYDRQDQSR